MPAAAVVTLVLTGVLILALALYLIVILTRLRRTIQTLGLITFGVRAIAARVEPIEPLATQMLEDLTTVSTALNDVLSSVETGTRQEV